MAILQVEKIEKHFGSTEVLRDISFTLEQGQSLAIIGSSGSGKTTLLRCLKLFGNPGPGHYLCGKSDPIRRLGPRHPE